MCRWRKEEFECTRPRCQNTVRINNRKIHTACGALKAWRQTQGVGRHNTCHDEEYDMKECTWTVQLPPQRTKPSRYSIGDVCNECTEMGTSSTLPNAQSSMLQEQQEIENQPEQDHTGSAAQLENAQHLQRSNGAFTYMQPSYSNASLVSHASIPATAVHLSDAEESIHLSQFSLAQLPPSVNAGLASYAAMNASAALQNVALAHNSNEPENEVDNAEIEHQPILDEPFEYHARTTCDSVDATTSGYASQQTMLFAGGSFSRRLPRQDQSSYDVRDDWDVRNRHKHEPRAAAYGGISNWISTGQFAFHEECGEHLEDAPDGDSRERR